MLSVLSFQRECLLAESADAVNTFNTWFTNGSSAFSHMTMNLWASMEGLIFMYGTAKLFACVSISTGYHPSRLSRNFSPVSPQWTRQRPQKLNWREDMHSQAESDYSISTAGAIKVVRLAAEQRDWDLLDDERY